MQQDYVGKLRPEDWRTGVNRALPAQWQPWTPTLVASTTNPTGWLTAGRWVQIGPTVTAVFTLTAQTGVTAGSGFYAVALPVAASYALGVDIDAGVARLYDASTGNQALALPYLSHASQNYAYFAYQTSVTAMGVVSDSAPWTCAAGDIIRGQITYEAALPE